MATRRITRTKTVPVRVRRPGRGTRTVPMRVKTTVTVTERKR